MPPYCTYYMILIVFLNIMTKQCDFIRFYYIFKYQVLQNQEASLLLKETKCKEGLMNLNEKTITIVFNIIDHFVNYKLIWRYLYEITYYTNV